MTVYDSAEIYLESRKDAKDKIKAIDAIIDALLLTAVKAAAGENITEYWLDDGQTKIKTIRRSSKEIEASIQAYQKLKQYYINQLNGRVMRMVDSKNFNLGRR
jgi:peptidyl-tRNA hydrolase